METQTTLPSRKRTHARRKACNECKQHKLRCDSVRTPTEPCSRCRRLKIECKVEPSFQRVSRRKRNAEMENEIAGLRQRLATSGTDLVSQCSGEATLGGLPASEPAGLAQSCSPGITAPIALTPLTAPSERSAPEPEDTPWTLETVQLPESTVAELFCAYFENYHPFLPLLDPQKSPLDYLRSCPLQAWTIICTSSRREYSQSNFLSLLSGPFTRLMWATLNSIPQDYNVIKALCLLCTWPLPTTTQRADPTFILSGLMMQMAMQAGLHRPVRAEEFTTLYISHGEAVKDRLQTWYICNMVAQNVATGYGQPSGTVYDWALEPTSLQNAGYYPSEDLCVRFRIEKFCDHVTRSLYNGQLDGATFITTEKLLIVQLLENELREIESGAGKDITGMSLLYVRAAELHLRCFVFLASNGPAEHLAKLFIAATAFLSRVLDLETTGQIGYATNYIVQMIVSATFALMRILKSRAFRHQIDFEYGKLLFNGGISALRRTSIMRRDRPDRLADVLAEMWNADDEMATPEEDKEDTLQLKICCRMSMSHLFDTVWRWRHRFRRGKDAEQIQDFCCVYLSPNLSDTDAKGKLNAVGGMTAQQGEGFLQDPTLACPSQFSNELPILNDGQFSEIFDSLGWVFDDLPHGLDIPPGV
ncbi:hypothetical protein BJY01DRAFT_263996 [Aspergillus pseudoustus]|uniref:Zn(2)-C6 fungal-type domain-containing protein n=1 Tax=Aspergillus pseudoustus TaxID=1810923 RepID=A0ABR4JWK0_9EURO